ncbi:MAG: glycosyltransferase family 4 protein [Pseudomonadota bacterium]|nr:glycosyltransferase family 4 protein [Pseudomonadota bacterium]
MAVKVTHVVRQYLPSVGGLEEVVRNIALRQNHSDNHQPRIVTLNRLFRNSSKTLPEKELIEGVEVVRLPYRGSNRYPVCPQVLRELGGADIVHVHGVDFFYDYLALTRRLHQRPLVLSTHGGFFHTQFASGPKRLYFNTITRMSATAYSKVVATSRNDGRLFRQIINNGKLKVIENGVDVDKFRGLASEQPAPTLIYFGRWSENKGLLEALELFAQLCAIDDHWRLIIAGREYDYTRDDLLAEVARLELSGRVTIAPNPELAHLGELIRQASYYLCLSRHEGFGIAAIEGMSAGLVPVLSDIPPFRRLVEQSGLGILHSNTSPQSTINALLTRQQQAQTCHQRERSQAIAFSHRYAWPQVADQYLRLYEQLESAP